MKMGRFLFTLAAVLSPGNVLAGGGVPTTVNVPAYTPWGAMAVAAVLGVSGAYALLKKRK